MCNKINNKKNRNKNKKEMIKHRRQYEMLMRQASAENHFTFNRIRKTKKILSNKK